MLTDDDVPEVFVGSIFKVNCNDELNNEFRNVVVSQPKTRTAGKPKSQGITFETRQKLEDTIVEHLLICAKV
jgi:hypothetical protein